MRPSGLRARRRGGFTLIELLAMIAIVAVLVALLMPALRAARRSAQTTVHHSNMRECLNVISLYAESYGSSFPFIGVAGQPGAGVDELNDLQPPGLGHSYNAGYFAANALHWPTVVQRAGFDIAAVADPDDDAREAMLDRYGGTSTLGSAYQLSHTTVATPAYWQAGPAPIAEGRYFRPMRVHQARYPSAKGLFLATRLGVFEQGANKKEDWVLVGFADNSVSRKEAPAMNGIEYRPYSCWNYPIMTTVDGIEGRDY